MEKKTPLYECHLAAGGKIVPFAGDLLPVQYPAGVIAEHNAVRAACGLFDVSHMGELLVEGADALAWLNEVLTNDFTSLAVGRVRYSPMCYPDGGVVDDLLVYKLAEEKYLIVVNAANREKDVEWLRNQLHGAVSLRDISDEVAQLALQGPASDAILASLLPAEQIPAKYYSFTAPVTVAGVECLLSQTGYTGSKGYELYCRAADAPALWNALLAAGEPHGLIPCGLGSRDTLRLEAAMPLYGHEMDETITPWEAGLDFGVKTAKNFIGRDAIVAKGRPRERIGLQVTGRGIVREHQDIYFNGKCIGHSTSGTHCPWLNGAYAMALVESGVVQEGDTVEADVRGRRVACLVVPMPFYKR